GSPTAFRALRLAAVRALLARSCVAAFGALRAGGLGSPATFHTALRALHRTALAARAAAHRTAALRGRTHPACATSALLLRLPSSHALAVRKTRARDDGRHRGGHEELASFHHNLLFIVPLTETRPWRARTRQFTEAR